MKAIQLIETRKGCAILEKTPRYIVMFRGEQYGELYFNMTGYSGCYLPSPPSEGNSPIPLDIGEKAISAYRREIAQLNREWAALDKRTERRH